ncbi:MAG: zinc-dependent alcohol dehydrogenase [Candidatus Promineifilaceae bacterium]
MMRDSLWFVGENSAEIRQSPIPIPNKNELLIETIASAISAGTEMLVYRGQAPAEMSADDTIEALAGTLQFPLKYGYASVGRVIGHGAAVDAEWLGRVVFAFNPHETHFVATPESVLIVPEGISAEIATLLPNMETAVSLVMDGQPVIGERVLVIGQGIVGLLTTLLLNQFPLAQLNALDNYPLRQTKAQQLGASTELDDKPFDLIYELTGNPHALNTAIDHIAYNGRIVIGSWYGQKTAPIALGGAFHRSHAQLISSQVSTLNPRWRGRWDKTRRLELAWQSLKQHQPSALITHQHPFQHAPDAYTLLDKTPEQAIQVVLSYKKLRNEEY